jgi:ubiquinone/menaquinone biosynthesis C-methylase UbiE
MIKQHGKSIYHFWDKNIDYYNLVSEFNKNINKRIFNILNRLIVKANKVLDIGCGEGSVRG